MTTYQGANVCLSTAEILESWNIPLKLCGTSCIEYFMSSGSTAGAAVVPLLPSIRSSSGGTAVYRLLQAAVVPLVVPLEVPADERSSQNTLTVPERYQCGTTAGFLCYSTKGPSGTTASTAVVPPDVAATVPHVVPLQLGSGVHQVP